MDNHDLPFPLSECLLRGNGVFSGDIDEFDFVSTEEDGNSRTIVQTGSFNVQLVDLFCSSSILH